MTTAGSQRYLIVNADDFGQSHGVNAGIADAHQRGILTSASMMVRWPAAAEAAAFAHAHPALGVGLHVDIGEWAFRDGQWVPLYEVAPRGDRELVAAEFTRQLDRFRELMGRDPSHLDSHQHVHNLEPIKSILSDAAGRLDIPLRGCTEEVRYSDEFYGQLFNGEPLPDAITPRGLIAILTKLPPGVTELGCHPGLGDDLDTMYTAERAVEAETLCHPDVRRAMHDLQIELCNFVTRPRVSPETVRRVSIR